jgi:hypothetical protein
MAGSMRTAGALLAQPLRPATPQFALPDGAKGANVVSGVLTIILGVWFCLIGLGKVSVSKNAEANAQIMHKWGKFFFIAGPIVTVAGVATLISFM